MQKKLEKNQLKAIKGAGSNDCYICFSIRPKPVVQPDGSIKFQTITTQITAAQVANCEANGGHAVPC